MKLLVIFTGLMLVGLVSGLHHNVTVDEYLRDSGYTTFYNLLKQVGLTTTLSGHGPFTVFVPSDDAFLAVDPTVLSALTNNNNQIIKLLKYHIVHEFILKNTVFGDETKVTLEGHELNITGMQGTLVVNGDANVTDATDTTVRNGAIQPIDKVLIPPGVGTLSITQMVMADDARFMDVAMALLFSGTYTILDSGDFTFFAPVDTAWAPYLNTVLSPAHENSTYYYQEIMKYHILPGGRTIAQMVNGQKISSLFGKSITVSKIGNSVLLNNKVRIVDSDIAASNGIMHAVDGFLIPPGLLPN